MKDIWEINCDICIYDFSISYNKFNMMYCSYYNMPSIYKSKLFNNYVENIFNDVFNKGNDLKICKYKKE